MITRSRIGLTHIIFTLSYALFVFSLFNRDVSDINVFYFLTTPAKYVALLLLTVGICLKSYSKHQIKLIAVILCADMIVLVRSGVLIFILISLFALYATKISDKDIIKIAYHILLLLTLSVFALSLLGVFDDKITSRWVNAGVRHSLGFYHSNVFPLIFCYLVGYGILSGIINKKHYLILIILDFVIYHFCGSRNSLFVVLILIIGKLIIDKATNNIRIRNNFNRIVGMIAKTIVPILTFASIVIPLSLDNSSLLRHIDFLLSYRFTYIADMIRKLGIGLIPKMSNDMYFNNEIVIDNGYAFITLRYGILVAILFSVLIYNMAKTYKDDSYVLFAIIVVAVCNLIDNDLIDYSVLPYLIIAEKCTIEGYRNKYGRFNKCNNELL